MHPTKQSYDEFKIWCAKQKYPLARTALNIASNRDNTNRTGHIMRGFLAARQYLHEYPEIIAVVKSRKLSVKKPIDTSNEKFIKTWLDFMENHKTQHAILQHILPIGLGGNVDSGGGGAYPFKVALRLVAESIDENKLSGEESKTPAKYRMVRKKEFDRDYPALNELKLIYDYKCQVCNETIQTGKNKYYCEAHHLRPLGGDHKGAADISNVVILCPNHHYEFDVFLFAILKTSGIRRNLEHLSRKLGRSENIIRVKHEIASENIDYVIRAIFDEI